MADQEHPIRWAAKVPCGQIRRLYQTDATGLQDEALVDEVGCGLYARCVSILEVTQAARGRAKCHGCGDVILHRAGSDEVLCCGSCGWQTTWQAYKRSYKAKQLFGGAALGAFEEFVAQYPAARTYPQKMLLVDRLIHAFHWNLIRGAAEPQATRPAAANLIECRTLREVAAFLDDLSGRNAETTVGPGGLSLL